MTIWKFLKLLHREVLKGRSLPAFCALLVFTAIASARTVPDPTDATGFFMTVADKLLRSTFSFGVTNIPVETNGVFVYNSAVQRLLQVTANLRDAATTNYFPTVYRPIFFSDGLGNISITGFEQILSATQFDNPLGRLPIFIPELPTGVSTNNVFGVPWIIGVKKGFPNFNQFVTRNDFQITRKLQVIRKKVETYTSVTAADFQTNQMLIMSITNHMGFSFWNSYAANYVPQSGAVSIVVNDIANMVLSNGVNNGMAVNPGSTTWPSGGEYLFQFATNLTFWPGSAWDYTQQPPVAAPNSNSSLSPFIAGTFDFPFLQLSAYRYGTGSFIPLSQNPTFETEANIIPTINPLPQFALMTTNGIQAYILDGNQIVDYVQFSGPTTVRNLNSEIQDLYTGVNNTPYRMWITNASGVPPNNGPSLGLVNQIIVSEKGLNVAPLGSWGNPGNLPAGIPATPAAEAAYFGGFFTVYFIYGGILYSNLNLTNQAPFTPTRLAYDYTQWQANDPLVHYLANDLNEQNEQTGLHISDDPVDDPPSAVTQYLGIVGDRYQPWGRDVQLTGLKNVDNNAFNLAYRDPLVYGPDDWDFPATNSLPLITLGQVHRGTPWQTIYLKSTNILDYVDYLQPNPLVGLNTWETWTSDTNLNDAEVMSPINDWRLAAMLAEMFNTNDATQLQSMNATTTGWQNVLNGLIVLTNLTATPYYGVTPQFGALVMTSNSPEALTIANALTAAQLNLPGQVFISAGDILNTPVIADTSPWLDTADADTLQYGISDAAYEAIPSQLLPLLRPDSTGSIVLTNSGGNVQFSGGDGFDYILQTSPDLVNWQTLGTNQPVQGILNFPAAPPPGPAKQFYRSILLP